MTAGRIQTAGSVALFDWPSSDNGFADPDLVHLAPLGPACCPCPSHGNAADGARLTEYSSNIARWCDREKTSAFSGTIMRQQHIFAEGLAPSPYPGADILVWEWTVPEYDYENGVVSDVTHTATNRFTFLNTAIMPDCDGDGNIQPGADADDGRYPGRVFFTTRFPPPTFTAHPRKSLIMRGYSALFALFPPFSRFSTRREKSRIASDRFVLYLKECEFRFNNEKQDLFDILCKKVLKG